MLHRVAVVILVLASANWCQAETIQLTASATYEYWAGHGTAGPVTIAVRVRPIFPAGRLRCVSKGGVVTWADQVFIGRLIRFWYPVSPGEYAPAEGRYLGQLKVDVDGQVVELNEDILAMTAAPGYEAAQSSLFRAKYSRRKVETR